MKQFMLDNQAEILAALNDLSDGVDCAPLMPFLIDAWQHDCDPIEAVSVFVRLERLKPGRAAAIIADGLPGAVRRMGKELRPRRPAVTGLQAFS